MDTQNRITWITKEHVRSWLRPQRGRLTRIALDAGVTYDWLVKFRRGEIENPRVDQLEKLIAVMVGEQERKAS